MNEKVLAIIPARGGSKRLYRKNIRTLDKIPLIAHTINVVKSCSDITHSVVSTEDEEIAELVLKQNELQANP